MTPQDFENALCTIRLGIREQGFIGGLNATRPLFPSMTLIERRDFINRNFSLELSEFQIKFSQQTKELEQSEEARRWYAAKYGPNFCPGWGEESNIGNLHRIVEDGDDC